MKKSQLEYMCFCLFVIVVCISIIGFTSCSDLKMKLVSEDLDTYFVEHAVTSQQTKAVAEQKRKDDLKHANEDLKNYKEARDTAYSKYEKIIVKLAAARAKAKDDSNSAALQRVLDLTNKKAEYLETKRLAQTKFDDQKQLIENLEATDKKDDTDESAKKDKKDKKGKHPGGGSKSTYYKSNCNDKQEREKTFKKLIASGCLKSTTNPGAGFGQMYVPNDSKVDVKGQCKDRVFNMTWASPTPDYKDIHGID